MRIAIVGAGAIGCTLGARLSERGHDVTLVGHAAQVDALRAGGLLLTDHWARTRRYHLNAVTRLEEQPGLVLLTVKTQDVAQACAELLPLAKGVPVVAMQNGVRCDALAAEVLGREAVVGAVVMIAATYLQPGQVSVLFPGWLIVGEPFGPPQPRTHRIAQTLAAVAPTYLTPRLEGVRWSKLISTLNYGLCAATGLTLPQVARTHIGRTASIQLMKEGWQVAGASGVRLDHGLYGISPRALRQDRNAALAALLQASMTTLLAHLPEQAASSVMYAASRTRLGGLPLRSSVWQSVATGRPSEVEYLNGEIIRRGTQLGIPTPYNTHVVTLVREVERSHTFCGVDALQPPGARQPARPPMTAGVE